MNHTLWINTAGARSRGTVIRWILECTGHRRCWIEAHRARTEESLESCKASFLFGILLLQALVTFLKVIDIFSSFAKNLSRVRFE